MSEQIQYITNEQGDTASATLRVSCRVAKRVGVLLDL